MLILPFIDVCHHLNVVLNMSVPLASSLMMDSHVWYLWNEGHYNLSVVRQFSAER